MIASHELPPHLRTVGVMYGNTDRLAGAKLVALSSVKFENIDGPTAKDPKGYETLRYLASLRASRSYAAAGVPQVVMVDTQSDARVGRAFDQAGAIVIPTPRPGLATPYLDGARLIRAYAGEDVSILKLEADKKLDSTTLDDIRAQLDKGFDVLVGDRTWDSMLSMTHVQHTTESILDTVIADILGIPRGASCGVQVYGPAGLSVFLDYEEVMKTFGNNWTYLIYVPAVATRAELRVASVPVNVIYDADMVAAENDLTLTLKRLEQLLIMLEGCLRVKTEVYPMRGLPAMAPDDNRRALADAAFAELRARVQQLQRVTA